MTNPESTCWTLIQGAAAGNRSDSDAFARRYAPLIAAFLAARWQHSPCRKDLDDAIQEVFLECFRQGGVLQRADQDRPGGFRVFLGGVVRNVALRFEARQARAREGPLPETVALEDVPTADLGPDQAFDRAWATALLREAAQRQEEQARLAGAAALRRVELLRLRFQEGLPIRAIAQRWQTDAAGLHREYARARQEFRAALAEVVAFHRPGPVEEIEQECADLLSLWR
jgi:RNA polymerase sigma-70 factor (ECF subfamily)